MRIQWKASLLYHPPPSVVNRLQYGRLARYSRRNTSYCAQSFLFAVPSTGRAHKRSPLLFAEAKKRDRLRKYLLFLLSLCVLHFAF